ncbi:MAG: 2OG-Fe(II) oxygenase family protein [Actinomycetota bacterium]|nr:2OG-Fe(II) oxygenase family protein [Actinomycetota bacterium]
MTTAGVPVVHLGDAHGLVEALATIGFVAVRRHGVPDRDLEAMQRLLVDLFAADEIAKRRQAVERTNYRGFIPLRFFTPNRSDADGTEPDAFEGYKLHWECPPGHQALAECDLYGANRWPEHLPDMPAVVASWWAAMDGFVDRLLDGVAPILGLDRSVLADALVAPLTNSTLLHYPPRRFDDPSPGFHAHKDITVLTVLDPDAVGGLEVRTREGEWVEPECPDDALLVNVGDVLEVWTGGRLVSTPHRVANPDGAERYSAPFFVVPNHAVVAEPLLQPVDGFAARSIPMGYVQAEVWRTNWPDEAPSDPHSHLGGVDGGETA